MRLSKSFIPTLKENPREAEVVSHKLMFRAGLIRRLAAGLYTYLPLGLKVIRKVEAIVRDEMNRHGAQELLMPAGQPRELWELSGRWDDKELGMVKFENREGREFVLGPTHEEIITDLVSREVKSYKELPLNLYQIQTKFRDELRPRFGVMRAREFIMKDAYSFDIDEEQAGKSYQRMYEAYNNIFRRCGLTIKVVDADPGAMGGGQSEEFMALAESGEDIIVSCPKCDYAANVESARKGESKESRAKDEEVKKLEEIETPDVKTIKELVSFLDEKPEKMIKTLIYRMGKDKAVAALLPGDREINELKLKKVLGGEVVEMADEKFIQEITGGPLGFSGPVGLKGVKIIADPAVMNIVNGITGANRKDKHFKNVYQGRDYQPDEVAEISCVVEGDRCPKCTEGILNIGRGIELGHIFALGDKYTRAMKAVSLDKSGKERFLVMGCYGIGISRLVAAIIEQNHDEDGIVWPREVSPYQVHLLNLSPNDSQAVETAAELYKNLTGEGIETIYDDRDERAGIKFKDADLLGVPIRLTVSSKRVAEKKVEFHCRGNGEEFIIKEIEVVGKVKEMMEKG